MPPSMYGIRRLLEVTLAILCFQTGSGSITTTIIEPIRSTGNEVGLIFIPEAYTKGAEYNTTARAIQEASGLRVWVALTQNYAYDLVTAPDLRFAVDQATKELKKAGMTSESLVGVGHGWAGHFLQDYARNSNLKAIVLLGSTVSRKTALRDYPIPVLTLAAELDGVTRMTRVAEEYEKLTNDMSAFFQGLYKTPVFFVEGANHAQFGAGTIWTKVDKGEDLAPEITDEQAHRSIGKYVNDFLTVTFSSVEDQVDQGLNNLVEPFMKAVNKFQPFLDMRNLDTDGEESMWTVLAQEIFAGEYSDRVAISNEITGNPWFFGKSPSIDMNNDDLIVGTKALVVASPRKSDDIKIVSSVEAPIEVNMKLVSKDAIWKSLAAHNDSSLRSQPNTCATLNRFALTIALGVSTDEARARYFLRGRRIIIEEDAMRAANFLWAPSSLKAWEDKDGLHIRSVAMVSSTKHYCKVLPVYRAMEWINIDSLRVNPYSG